MGLARAAHNDSEIARHERAAGDYRDLLGVSFGRRITDWHPGSATRSPRRGCRSAPVRRLIVVTGTTSLESLAGWHETAENWEKTISLRAHHPLQRPRTGPRTSGGRSRVAPHRPSRRSWLIQQTLAKYGCCTATLQANRHGGRGTSRRRRVPYRPRRISALSRSTGVFSSTQRVPSEEVGLGPISQL